MDFSAFIQHENISLHKYSFRNVKNVKCSATSALKESGAVVA